MKIMSPDSNWIAAVNGLKKKFFNHLARKRDYPLISVFTTSLKS
jgi:hypothetical protein